MARLRDQFAMAAMQAIITKIPGRTRQSESAAEAADHDMRIARSAYKYADAMLKYRATKLT